MAHFRVFALCRNLLAPLLAGFYLLASPALAADDADAPKGVTVTVLKAAKSCSRISSRSRASSSRARKPRCGRYGRD